MNFGVALLALAIEAGAGYPDALFRRIGHPVTWMGALIAGLDRGLNREGESFARRRSTGALALAMLLVVAVGSGALIQRAALALPLGWIALAVLASSLLAQRSLHAHVAAVAEGLAISVQDGRAAVAKIVGRDVSALDASGVARAAIESLAENFSDGVVAPALWLAFFGLPGALAYKIVNTADSMIGHKSPRHRAFGWAAARCDDVMNFLPARASAGLLAIGALAMKGASPAKALTTAWRDAPHHVSPNAGWPEAAAAGALGLKLGGPRAYGGAEAVDGANLGDGRREANAADIRRALALYQISTATLWFLLAVGALTARV
ncbi:adenosylcobinamide-phosphate synthase CbiB [Methylocystis sp. SC2]|uniref:adenosylcobinamide-phosphate synthase CbiB n=1 Tax=Methylocystis sp. (strain SC2) TaxID=187303 RepID=UPI00027AF405|nr:adenosylcobinamide-phosphate synthase CbiB [Methylocystis sp. SC2]CCJ08439.1 Cobalamin biosynthesis protein CobD [Methylocystis sp. SC2]